MKIGAINKCSLIDYPGKVAAVIGTQGCNMRCFWCHNYFLIPFVGSSSGKITKTDIFDFLKERTHFLDAVVISGGEPTLHGDLAKFCEKIKALGYAVKLDTNGSNPVMLRDLIDNALLDYVAMDIKTDAERYGELFKEKIGLDNIWASIDILRSGDIPHEFRTTCVAPFISMENVGRVVGLIKGAKLYYLQKCSDPQNTAAHSEYRPLGDAELVDLKFRAAAYVENCAIR